MVSGGNYVLGPNHRAFEQEIAEYHHVKHAIGVANGIDALRIMMDAIGGGPGDEVITTAFTFVASAETIVQTGATPVFVEIDPETFNIDPSARRVMKGHRRVQIFSGRHRPTFRRTNPRAVSLS